MTKRKRWFWTSCLISLHPVFSLRKHSNPFANWTPCAGYAKDHIVRQALLCHMVLRETDGVQFPPKEVKRGTIENRVPSREIIRIQRALRGGGGEEKETGFGRFCCDTTMPPPAINGYWPLLSSPLITSRLTLEDLLSVVYLQPKVSLHKDTNFISISHCNYNIL